MAALAGPLIEAAAVRALAALGVGAAGTMTAQTARNRQQEGAKASAMPIARVDACTEVNSKCKDCPPDKGIPYLRNTAGWSDASITYQIRIAQMPPALAGFLTEWEFRGVKFDGFDASQCLLKESKAKYDKFFDDYGAPRDWWTGDVDIQKEATSQSTAAKPMPPVQLRWYFMTPMMYRYCSQLFAAMGLQIETQYQP